MIHDFQLALSVVPRNFTSNVTESYEERYEASRCSRSKLIISEDNNEAHFSMDSISIKQQRSLKCLEGKISLVYLIVPHFCYFYVGIVQIHILMI